VARVAEISWAPEDALPFPLCISTAIDNERVGGISVARGNVVLADHGLTVTDGEPYQVLEEGPYRLTLQSGPLTQQGHVYDRQNELVPFDPAAPAVAALRWEMGDVQPAVELLEGGDDDRPWRPQRDLLGSDRFANEFVVEMEEDGRAFLRFGVPPLGRVPADTLTAVYRVGNGKSGNVGAGSITDAVTGVEGISGVRNPFLPAGGGPGPGAPRTGAPLRPPGLPRAGARGHRGRLRGRRRAAPGGAAGGRHPTVERQLAHLVRHH